MGAGTGNDGIAEEIQERDFQFAEQVVTRLEWMTAVERAEFFAYLGDNYCWKCGHDRVEGGDGCGCI
jgi:hypothetical protein